MRARDTRKRRNRYAHLYAVFIPCDLCGAPDGGRGADERGAKSGLAQHKRRHHGVVGSNHKSSSITNAMLDAIGEYLEACGGWA